MMNHTLHLCSIPEGPEEIPAVVHPQRGLARVRDLLPDFDGDIRDILVNELLDQLESAAEDANDSVFRDPSSVSYGAPYRHPRMLWGIGLNYVEHASDLSEGVPEEPASFIKGDHTVIASCPCSIRRLRTSCSGIRGS